jgi:hypothetical protein
MHDHSQLLLYTLICPNCLEKLKIELGRKEGKKKRLVIEVYEFS